MIYRLSLLFFIVVIVGMVSCKNNDEVFKTVTYTDLTVVNASPDTLNYYLNGTRQNNSSSLYPNSSVIHSVEPAGAQNYAFKKAGSFNVLFSVPSNLTAQTYNSLYITGESASDSFFHADTLYTDTLANTATVRFVNAARDAGNLDVYVDSATFKGRAYKTTSTFIALGSGLKEVKIFQAGAATPKVDTIITIYPNQVYTLFAKGLLAGKGTAVFNLGIVINTP